MKNEHNVYIQLETKYKPVSPSCGQHSTNRMQAEQKMHSTASWIPHTKMLSYILELTNQGFVIKTKIRKLTSIWDLLKTHFYAQMLMYIKGKKNV